MTKTQRKLKVEFPLQKIKRNSKEESKKTVDTEDKEELEEIVLDEPPKIRIPQEEITPNLKLSESTLETQIQNTPTSQNKENTPQNQLYESIKYSNTIETNYQESSYNPISFNTAPSPSMDFSSPQQDFSRNPLTGFRQANPFEPQGYPKTPEKNYESAGLDNNKKRRRM